MMLTKKGRDFLLAMEAKDLPKKKRTADIEFDAFYKQKTGKPIFVMREGRNFDDEYNYEAASWMIENGRRK